jgi:beta-lactamase superfamily II metal-dependent hydrolase
MAVIHFLNVLEGDCNIIQHDTGRLTVIDVSNAYNDYDTEEEKKVKISKEREERRLRTQIPAGKIDYKQKHTPDNPILYLREKIKPSEIFRFIITHPDMDHIDGIRDLYEEYFVRNTWDTENKKELDLNKRYYTCVLDKNRSGSKKNLLFELNLDLNTWSEVGEVHKK